MEMTQPISVKNILSNHEYENENNEEDNIVVITCNKYIAVVRGIRSRVC